MPTPAFLSFNDAVALLDRIAATLPSVRDWASPYKGVVAAWSYTVYPARLHFSAQGYTGSAVCSSLTTKVEGKNLTEVVSYEENADWTLLPGAIRKVTAGNYPHFEIRWSGWESDPRKRGQLNAIRVDLSTETFALYERGGGKFGMWGCGNQELLEQLPDSLVGANELMGTPLSPIKYSQEADRIIRASGLPGFVSALTGSH